VVELVVGLLVTAGLSPVVRAAMLRHGVLDVPNHRSSHTVAVARGGGLACLGGVLVAVAVAAVRGTSVPWVAVAACAMLSLLGLADDRLTLSPMPRVAIQVLAGGAVGLAAGGVVGLVVGALLMTCVVNVVNFMDGINGITSLTMAVWGLVALLVGRQHDADGLALVGALAAGAALGFLPWNSPVPRLFLGDAGSYLFGALAASGLVLAWGEGAPVLLVAAPLAVYAADTAWTLVGRARRGARLTEAHREHTYQHLTSGPTAWPHLAVAAAVAGLALAITAAWAWLPAYASLLVSVALLAAYLSAPALVSADRRRSSTSGA
jgi:UDP-N-acetylmuramyl pentapeptide phosphotransferase/UDP-N-acetylglucosamine-1-phosphate transferase